ncbi:glycosyltransferase family 4 protein [Microbacterium sp. SORGH_AS_0888]|uniref:glycosyltransferase family 4 protein n=1 Tax=Microbacterium sp. SORGH_AS_0888 TaxID=3041791 RepID=UPI00278ABACF|nr:glycosyltransferase involved in cell wall biosynthesis [Microbacterium sp. SORGH_AS_0888]
MLPETAPRGHSKRLIVILTPTSNRSAGGVERFASLLVEQLSENFEVVLHEAPPVESKWARRFGLTAIMRARRSRIALKSMSPDILITNGALGAVGGGPWQHIHVYHGTLPSHSFADRAGRRWRDWLVSGAIGGGLCEFLSGVGATRVAVSNSAADEVRRHYRFRRPIVIENGVRIASPRPDSVPRELVLFVGRRESRKGYETAVRAASIAGSMLSVAGPGHDERTNDLGLLTEPEVAAALRKSVALILPTKYEACSLAILEAISHGCPVITTRVGWIRDLEKAVPAYSKLLIPAESPAAIASVLVRLKGGDKDLWRAVADAQQLVMSRNSLESFGKKWTSVVREGQVRS